MPERARILVVDDDPWLVKLICTALGQRYECIGAADGIEGLAKALVRPPKLIVSDVMMPRMSGWELVKQVRSHSQLAFVPFIFLTALGSEDDRLYGFRLGADEYLPKPIDIAELGQRVDHVLQRLAQLEQAARDRVRKAPPKGAPGLRGDLDQLGLSSLLVMLEMERKSGLLGVTRDAPAERVRIYLIEGRIVAAQADDGQARNADAVYHVLGWKHGHFEFNAFLVEMRDEVEMSTTGLLLEGARRIDEAARA
ncbi:response regulator [Nannocystis bainbridge]|uniref:DUF4388 domain-containing protein n=1 Tax=Nannocystis bainbridge TaxID=2995303 RepID=A0ABT5E5S9_9BACT|nr:DUF4388 domain-containing protein [Nannocystis bainbridge]MDC0721207.1 DUF4388 domain-containing protein [Nannocystis bainbridge]